MRRFLRDRYLSFFGNFLSPSDGIHIINSHYVTKYYPSEEDFQLFEDFLRYLSIFAKFVPLEEATRLILDSNYVPDKPVVSFTFDDGYEECYTVIAPLLEKYNTRGTFFINANFIGSGAEYQKEFYSRVPNTFKKPMSWDQVISLHNKGHLIGSHTLDHLNMALLSDDDLTNQLSENKSILESKLQYSCDYFAWPFGENGHFPDSALEKALRFHKYIYSGTDYKSYFSRDNKVINRRHIEPCWPKNHLNYFLAVNKRPST